MQIQQVTKREYTILQKIYNELNKSLFSSELGDCLIVLQRQPNSVSSFSPARFSARRDKLTIHEISLNPDSFGNSDEIIISNLVHEMCHYWVYSVDKISKSTPRYHNHAWAEKMLSIGLQPISHDSPGAIVGQKVSHEIIPNERFDKIVKSLVRKQLSPAWKSVNALSELESSPSEKKRNDPSKTKFHCVQCGQNAWAKETASLICGVCFINMNIDYS